MEQIGDMKFVDLSARHIKHFMAKLFSIPYNNPRGPGLHYCRSGSCCVEVESLYDTSMALVTFCFGSVFGIVTVRMPSSTLAEI